MSFARIYVLESAGLRLELACGGNRVLGAESNRSSTALSSSSLYRLISTATSRSHALTICTHERTFV